MNAIPENSGQYISMSGMRYKVFGNEVMPDAEIMQSTPAKFGYFVHREKTNCRMPAMIGPAVHFHVIPRRKSARACAGMAFPGPLTRELRERRAGCVNPHTPGSA